MRRLGWSLPPDDELDLRRRSGQRARFHAIGLNSVPDRARFPKRTSPYLTVAFCIERQPRIDKGRQTGAS
jgi:hypothetical protein